MKKYFILPVFLFILLTFALSACAGTPPTPTPDQLGTVVASTLTAVAQNAPAVQSATATLEPDTIISTTDFPPAIVPTVDATGGRYIYTTADNVNLRVSPGRSFKVSRVLPNRSRLQLIGAAPGGGWLNVANDEGIIGWVGIDFVTKGFDLPFIPVITPKDVQVVSGKVLDASGNPISGIGFAVTQNDLREDAATDSTGTFYAYLPLKFSGTWTVSFTSVNCTSNTMDANCQCLGGTCGKPDPQMVTITLPLSTPLSFGWR